MAKFELNIYGNDDEIIKKHSTNKVRWGVLLQALDLQDGLDDLTVSEQFEVIGDFIKNLFPALTDDELRKADMDDVFNTFRQLINYANKVGAKSKNATGAVTK